MDSILRTIKENNLIKRGDVIGVALSGGMDSMALFSYLCSISEDLDFEVVGIHVDHSIRETSSDDARFVISYCRERNIRAYKFKVDASKLAKEKNISIESAAREARYGVFEAAIKKGIVDKIAIAHHMSDQAETILLHLFRGSGVAGAKGMEEVHDNMYIRPMLNTEKSEIVDYIAKFDIPYVQDETNFDDTYTRNYLRNKVFPILQKQWPNVIPSLVAFGKACTEDDNYINSQVLEDALIIMDKTVKIPKSYFLYPNAIITRLIFKAFKIIGVTKDIERKHIEMIKELVKNGENGSKLNLPFSAMVYKEYDYITITNKFIPKPSGVWDFKCGSFEVPNFGSISIKRVKQIKQDDKALYIDYKKVPKDAAWRFRQDGDVFAKFGGGTKKLKGFLIDKKVPLRERDNIPVLASGNNVLVIAGVEISSSIKVDDNSNSAYKIEVKR